MVAPQHKKIYFDNPTGTMAVSVTGSQCSRGCGHCHGRFLRHMLSPELALRLAATGNYTSALVSGGCTATGRVPLAENKQFIRELHSRGLRLNFHTGWLLEHREQEATREVLELASAVCVELDGSTESVRTYDFLAQQQAQCGYRLVPHLMLGVDQTSAEKVLRFLGASYSGPLVVLVLRPTPGVPPIDVAEAERLLVWVREMLPVATLCLGCMRPSGSYRDLLDVAALKAGFDRVVLPSPAARRYTASEGLQVAVTTECCALGEWH